MPYWLRRLSFLPALLGILILAGCERATEQAAENTLTVLAGSELKDVEPLLPQLEAATGVRLKFEYSGTLDGVERLQGEESFDTAWFSHAKYLMLEPKARARVRASEKIMLSPVAVGVKADRFKALGWERQPDLGWKEIARAAEAGRFRFAMTNPTSSNSGFSALMGVAAAFSGKADALTEADVERLDLSGLFKGHQLTAGSSGWLAEAYAEGNAPLDGMINYESVLLAHNATPGAVPMRIVYPKDGILTADYPLLLLDEQKRAAYEKVVAWLKGETAQTWLMRETRRRPVNPAVAADRTLFPEVLLGELSFPARIEVIDRLLLSYLGRQRRPSHAFFVLDISGSMEGERLNGLRAALIGLAGGDATLTGRFARFQNRERITLIPFSSRVEHDLVLAADMGDSPQSNERTLARLRDHAQALHTRGGTALYDAIVEAYRQTEVAMRDNPDRYYTIVAMTDGQSNEGMSLEKFRTLHAGLPESLRQVRVFTVLFGNGNAEELTALAELTGGRMFDSRKIGLSSMFKAIRGYQ
ncbi:VWA domain-containing protein [Azonexus hydrophilus]|uniref:VWA domain-containing protein n=1 Tax=Azonexus hydrophilus TaxID=418702 RepID=A0ABZ2XDS5_9RHOO